MADQRIRDLINRIDEDLNEIENAQSLIERAGEETERLQGLSSKLINSSDRHINHIRTQFDEELAPKLKQLIEDLTNLNNQNQDLVDQINGLDFVSLKDEITNIQTTLSNKIDTGISSLSEKQETDTNALSSSIAALENSISSVSESLKALDTELKTNYSQTKEQLKQFSNKTDLKADGIFSNQKKEFNILNQKQDNVKTQIDTITKEFNHHRSSQRIWLILLSVGVVLILSLQVSTYFLTPTVSTNSTEQEAAGTQKTPTETSPPANKPKKGTNSTPQPPGGSDASGKILSPEDAQDKLGKRAEYVMTYLKGKNYNKLTEKYFHPKYGVSFLPYGLSSDEKKLMPQEIKEKWDSQKTVNWGETPDGSSIDLSMEKYHNKYIYDQEYLLGIPNYNQLNLSASAEISLENLSKRFKGGIFVEFPNEECSLILVFQNVENGYPSVSGIIHVER